MFTGNNVCLRPCRLIVLLLAALLSAPSLLHAAVSVEGTLTIPGSAPAGGVSIDVFLEDADSLSYTAITVDISGGGTSASYSLAGDYTNATVRYYCLSNCGDIYPAGYLSDTGISYKWTEARTFIGINSGVNINLPAGYRVTGQVSLPVSQTAATDITLELNAYDQDFYTVSDWQYIPAGGTTVAYSLLLPPAPTQTWVVEYVVTGGGQNKYFPTGYYDNYGLSSTYRYDLADRLNGSQAYSGINLVLIYANTVTGTVALPDGRKADAGGMEIIMYTRNRFANGGDDSLSVFIPEGGSSAAYTLLMPSDIGSSWGVRYQCRNYYCGGGQYLNLGYYAGPSAPTAFSDPGYWLGGGSNYSNVNLTLIKAKSIYGKVTLPKPAPSGGIFMHVQAYDPSPVVAGFTSSTFTIPKGGTSANYNVQVPDDTSLSWRVGYRIFSSNTGYVPLGYYTLTGTTHIETSGSLLAGGIDHYNINMQAIPDRDNDGIPDSIDPVNNIMNPGVLLLLRNTP
ncbi:MAG: hypothetical protein ACYCYR_03305 [Desulfobulbaceae bacterium]